MFDRTVHKQFVACENAGWAAYSQLHLHVTGEYSRQQTSINSQTTEYVARHPVTASSLVLVLMLAKIRNFERVVSKT